MEEENKKSTSSKNLTVLVLVAVVVAVIIIFGMRISDGLVSKSRVSAVTQTLKSTAGALTACQIGGLAILPPDDAQNPQNSPCSDTTKYAVLGTNSTSGCVYNTSFVPVVVDGVIAGAGIQAGCSCKGKTIATCSEILQCDLGSAGNCTFKNIAN